MLARNYKTADELGITEWQHKGFVSFIDGVDKGEINERNFDIRDWNSCIWGWAFRYNEGAAPAGRSPGSFNVSGVGSAHMAYGSSTHASTAHDALGYRNVVDRYLRTGRYE